MIIFRLIFRALMAGLFGFMGAKLALGGMSLLGVACFLALAHGMIRVALLLTIPSLSKPGAKR